MCDALDVWHTISRFGGALAVYVRLVRNFDVHYEAARRIQYGWRHRPIFVPRLHARVAIRLRLPGRALLLGKIVHVDAPTQIVTIDVSGSSLAKSHYYFLAMQHPRMHVRYIDTRDV